MAELKVFFDESINNFSLNKGQWTKNRAEENERAVKEEERPAEKEERPQEEETLAVVFSPKAWTSVCFCYQRVR